MTTNDVSEEKLASLLKDGISEDLFRLLWAKDELSYGPSINIPDTIIYKYGTPVSWYFTSVNGKVKKKLKQNLVSAKIEEVFNKHVLGYDVLAVFISMPSETEAQTATVSNVIEYLDREALNNFLYNRKKEVNGILQRFIEPKSTHNEIVRAIWSPKVCLLERAENIHQLHDHRYGLYERCVIYEGPEYYTTSAPLRGPVLSGKLQNLCESVVSHISEVTFGQKQVSRIVLNFKVDSRDTIWLLFSTSIRCIDMLEYTNAADAQMNLQRHLVNIDSVVSLSNTVHLNPSKTYEKIIPKKRIRCLSCSRDTLEDMRHPVTYKAIIKHYDHVMHLLTDESSSGKEVPRHDRMISWPPDAQIVEAAGGVGFGCLYITDVGEVMTPVQVMHYTKQRHARDLKIPPILHNIHYKLSLKSYDRCKNDPLFLYKTVHVCEPCYLVYAEFTTMLLRMGQDLTKLLTPDPVATQLLQERSSANLERPSSADWRAVSTAHTSTAGMFVFVLQISFICPKFSYFFLFSLRHDQIHVCGRRVRRALSGVSTQRKPQTRQGERHRHPQQQPSRAARRASQRAWPSRRQHQRGGVHRAQLALRRGHGPVLPLADGHGRASCVVPEQPEHGRQRHDQHDWRQ